MTPTRIAADLWLLDGPVRCFLGFRYPVRSVVIRLGDGGLWVWSPVPLTAATAEAVERLGRVRHLVSPNNLHHLWLEAWRAAYPEARLWGPAATHRKRRDLAFAGVLDDTPPAAWAGEIEQCAVAGSFLIEEVAFFHRASRTAILADLTPALSEDFLRRHWAFWQRPLGRCWGFAERRPSTPLPISTTYSGRSPRCRCCDISSASSAVT